MPFRYRAPLVLSRRAIDADQAAVPYYVTWRTARRTEGTDTEWTSRFDTVQRFESADRAAVCAVIQRIRAGSPATRGRIARWVEDGRTMSVREARQLEAWLARAGFWNFRRTRLDEFSAYTMRHPAAAGRYFRILSHLDLIQISDLNFDRWANSLSGEVAVPRTAEEAATLAGRLLDMAVAREAEDDEDTVAA